MSNGCGDPESGSGKGGTFVVVTMTDGDGDDVGMDSIVSSRAHVV